MSDPFKQIAALRRPRLLVRAARHGLDDYDRVRDLPRILRSGRLPAPTAALDALLAAEEAAEQTRLAGDAAYSAARHVELLIALMGEARLLRPRPA